MKKVIMLPLLWIGILGGFLYYGYFICGDADIRSQAYLGPQFALECRTENAVLWGGFGIGLATCIVAGLLIVSLVRRRHLKWGWAVLFLAASAIGSSVLTAVGIETARNCVPFEILHGESGMNIYFMTSFTELVVALGFVVFSVWVVCARMKNRDEARVA
jgi:hypothetical protein